LRNLAKAERSNKANSRTLFDAEAMV